MTVASPEENSSGVPVLPPGTRIGDFLLEGTIGHGGFSVVYKAHQVKLDREVAVKILKPQGTRNSITARRFTREINLVKTIEHPNIIRLYDFGETDDGKLWMATELVKGKTLSEMLHEQGPLQPARARHVVLQVLSALVEAHDHGIIHRDIKPSNIMVARKGADLYFAKVLDFGIGKAMADSADDLNDDLSMEGGAGSGTPRYMAPEQFSQENVGPHTDVYSLGLVLYEMLTATRAIPGSTVYEIVARVCSEPVEFPEAFHPAFRDIIYKATRPVFQDRYPTALAFYKTIEESIDERGNDARGVLTAGPPPVPTLTVEADEEPAEPMSLDIDDEVDLDSEDAVSLSEPDSGARDRAKPDASDSFGDAIAPIVVQLPKPAPVPVTPYPKDDRLFNTKEAAFIQSELEEGYEADLDEAYPQAYTEPFWKNSVIWGVAVGVLILLTVVAMVALITSENNDGHAKEDGAVSGIGSPDSGAEAPQRTGGADEIDEQEPDDDSDDEDGDGEKVEGDGDGEKDEGETLTFAPDDQGETDKTASDKTPAKVESVALSLVSSPEGASVVSDGKIVCEGTPCSVNVDRDATVRLAFKLAGYATKRVRLVPSESQTVDVTMIRPDPQAAKKSQKDDKKSKGSNPFAKIKHH